MRKLFVSDLDGTLFYHNDENNFSISDENLFAINDFVSDGNIFAIATARSREFHKDLIEMLGFVPPFICDNGATVITHDYKVKETNLTFHDFKRIDDYLVNNNINGFVGTYLNKRYYTSNQDNYPFKRNDIGFRGREGFLSKSINLQETNYELDKVCSRLLVLIHPENMEKVKEDIRDLFKEDYEIVSSDIDNIDIVRKGCSKGNGIRILQEYYGISFNNSGAIGDSENDISMFDEVKYSYAMDNAIPITKSKAKQTIESVGKAIIDFNAKENSHD